MARAARKSSVDDDKDPITIRIFSYNSDFSGYYILNGGAQATISGGDDKTNLFYGEFTLVDVDQVEVQIKTDSAADYLAVRVYRDGVKVKEGLNSSSIGEILTVNLTYTYDEEDVSEGE